MKLRAAITANAHWLRTIRLVDKADFAWLTAALALSAVLLFVLLASTSTDILFAIVGVAAHLTFVACIYLAAARAWLWRLALIVCLSQVNLLVYIWSSGPQLWLVLEVYGALAPLAVIVSLVVEVRSRRNLATLGPDSTKDDFRWLVTSGPLALRLAAARILHRLAATER